jgi:hypothetical protein
MIVVFSTLDHAKPDGNDEQAVLSSCSGWTFWTGSDFKVSDRDIAEGKAALSTSSPLTCTDVDKNQSRGAVQVK